MRGIDLQLESEVPFGRLVYGADYYQDEVDSSRRDLNPDGSLDRIRIQGPIGDDSSYDVFGAYGQGEFELTDRLDLTVGGRYTHIRAKVGRFEDPSSGEPSSFSDQWETLVGSVRASYDIDSEGQWKLWAGISQSFRAPNIADLSRFGRSRSNENEVPATDLEPENFLTYEVGLRAELDRLNFSGTYHYTRMRDFVTSKPTGNRSSEIVNGVDQDIIEVSKKNSASGYVQGIELAAEYEIGSGWEAFGNLTWLEGGLESEPLSRIAPITANAGIRWTSAEERWWASLHGTFVDRADKLSARDLGDTQRIPPDGTPGYALLNLRGGCQVNEHLRVTLGLENLLDEAYRSHGSGSNEPGFGVTFGATASF